MSYTTAQLTKNLTILPIVEKSIPNSTLDNLKQVNLNYVSALQTFLKEVRDTKSIPITIDTQPKILHFDDIDYQTFEKQLDLYLTDLENRKVLDSLITELCENLILLYRENKNSKPQPQMPEECKTDLYANEPEKIQSLKFKKFVKKIIIAEGFIINTRDGYPIIMKFEKMGIKDFEQYMKEYSQLLSKLKYSDQDFAIFHNSVSQLYNNIRGQKKQSPQPKKESFISKARKLLATKIF
jgi:hypothetical protein